MKQTCNDSSSSHPKSEYYTWCKIREGRRALTGLVGPLEPENTEGTCNCALYDSRLLTFLNRENSASWAKWCRQFKYLIVDIFIVNIFSR